jgi:Na+-transporting methylmalonyl-CoA/oxaloacetate decarboxylase gamma subunit
MISFVFVFVFIFIGVVTGLAVFARLAKACAGEPKKAEKWEKGEIIKQLVALSERENSDQTPWMPKSKSKFASALLSCIRNAAGRMETQRMTGCKQRRKC